MKKVEKLTTQVTLGWQKKVTCLLFSGDYKALFDISTFVNRQVHVYLHTN